MVARHDLTTDPALQQELLTVRRGTAFFSRKLNEIRDADLDQPSLLPGWSRRHLAAHVGYNARALARLVEWAATGVETPMYASMEVRNQEIAYGATLSPIALRHLYEHSAIHLNVEWRDLPEEKWSHEVRTAQGRTVPVSETVWMRTRELWIHAVDLDNGARFEDIPTPVLERLLTDITGAWNGRGEGAWVLDAGGKRFGAVDVPEARVVTGSLPALAAWAAGRTAGGQAGVSWADTSGDAEQPVAPRWI